MTKRFPYFFCKIKISTSRYIKPHRPQSLSYIRSEYEMFRILTIDDCHEVVKRAFVDVSSFELTDFSLEPLGGKSGFMGEHAILRIELNQNTNCKPKRRELKFFVKSLSDVESQRNFISESGAFFKEEKMFCKIVPLLLKHGVEVIAECVPKCFLVCRSEVFVFEDLSSQGYKILNHRESFDLPKTKIALNAIAKLHASGLILEEKLTKLVSGAPFRLTSECQLEFQEAFYTQNKTSIALIESARKGVATQIDLLLRDQTWGSATVGEFKNFAQSQMAGFPESVRTSQRFRNVICHGDLWAANIMFKFDVNGEPTHCYLVDFQSYRYCPPAQDVLAFIYLTTDRNFRGKHLADVLLYYRTQLTQILLGYGIHLDDVISCQEFWESCEHYKLFAIAQEIMHSQVIMMSPRDLEDFLTTPGYTQRILYGDRSDLINRLCRNDRQYRKKQCESILDLKEIFEKQRQS